MIITVHTADETASSTAGTSGSRCTDSVSMSRPRSTSSPITALGTRPSVTEIAARTIDSVNALTPYPVIEMSAASVARNAASMSTPGRDVRAEQLDESMFGVGERVLAQPQRVIGIERDDVELVDAPHDGWFGGHRWMAFR